MTLSRKLRRLVCQCLAGVLLFAQMAVAAYACPGLSSPMPMATAAAMPGCDEMDPDAAALCAEHCRFGQQSVDTAAQPAVQAAAPALLYLLPDAPVLLANGASPQAAVDTPPAAPPPPHAILHCVLRI
ncbi:hypothetical protein [Ideonella sp. BN130291]|uniref:hypothetical protein n=1 Tax=Ideonella sp. BN130291 TaxID=3112940 RepID=UPI002E26D834|nr:hypothetical protein [Ideonella sp. BN130291]